MILSTHGIVGSSIVQFSFDADYQAVLDYATTQGYTLPSASQQLLQNQLVVDLKDGGIWSKLDTFAVFATDGNSDFALIDWIRLSQYTAVNSPTFTTNQGFKGDGVSSYIESNFSPATNGINYTSNSAGFGYYMRQYDTSPSIAEGAWRCQGASTLISWIRYTAKRLYINSGISTYIVFTAGENQFAAANRTSSGTTNLYSNGLLTDTVVSTANGLSASTFRVFEGSGQFSDSQVSMVYAGADLSSEQNNFYTAFYTNYLLSI
jgi:hypothetical protein